MDHRVFVVHDFTQPPDMVSNPQIVCLKSVSLQTTIVTVSDDIADGSCCWPALILLACQLSFHLFHICLDTHSRFGTLH